MKIRNFLKMVPILATLALAACGGGGGPAGPPAGSVVISGAAVKGPVSGGDVAVYPVVNGIVGTTPLITGKTAADGSYTLIIPPDKAPSGPIVVEVTGGTYTDEATGTTAVPLTSTIRAVVSAAATGDRIAVTPLTELAYQKAAGAGSGNLTPSIIDDANGKIAQTFGVTNIITSIPFDPTRPAPASASADDKRYAAAVGVISTMVKNTLPVGTPTKEAVAAGLAALLSDLGTELQETGGFSAATATSMDTALTDFAPTNTGGTVPQAIAFQSGILTLRTTGTLATGIGINGIHVTVTLPAGVTVNADGVSGELASGVLVASGQATGAELTGGRYIPAAGDTPATVTFIIADVAPGFAVGEFARLTLNSFVDGTYAISGPAGAPVPDISGSPTNSSSAPVTITDLTVSATLSGL